MGLEKALGWVNSGKFGVSKIFLCFWKASYAHQGCIYLIKNFYLIKNKYNSYFCGNSETFYFRNLWWIKSSKEQHLCHDNSRRDLHGNVHDNVDVFGFGGIDLLHYCGRASNETHYCQYIHNVRNTAAANITYKNNPLPSPHSIHESPRSRSIQVELGKVEGFWSTLQTVTASTDHIFECWAERSLAKCKCKCEYDGCLSNHKEIITTLWSCLHYVELGQKLPLVFLMH